MEAEAPDEEREATAPKSEGDGVSMSKAIYQSGAARQQSHLGAPPRLTKVHNPPHSLGNGWVKELVKLADGLYSTPWGTFNDEEVRLAEAAEVSPRAVRLYAAEIIRTLGLEGQLKI